MAQQVAFFGIGVGHTPVMEDSCPIPKSLASVQEKVVIFLRATGNAPILKQNKFKVSSTQNFLYVQEFVRKQLLFHEQDPLVIRPLALYFVRHSAL